MLGNGLETAEISRSKQGWNKGHKGKRVQRWMMMAIARNYSWIATTTILQHKKRELTASSLVLTKKCGTNLEREEFLGASAFLLVRHFRNSSLHLCLSGL